jgi:hypothetical protein
MIRAVDVALAGLAGDQQIGGMNLEDLFQGFEPSRYEDEARRRWGTAGAFLESERRTCSSRRGLAAARGGARRRESTCADGGASA